MNGKELSKLTDEELLKVAKDSKPSPIIDAFFIGFLVGIIIYGVAANTWGLGSANLQSRQHPKVFPGGPPPQY